MAIPYVTLIGEDGKPDFRVTDEAKRRSVIRNGWCQLCGQPLGKYFFFTGGRASAINNTYFEPATHLDCLIYAMQVCPFIVGRVEHADPAKIADAHTDMYIKSDSNFAAERNPWWVIKKADGWQYTISPEQTLLLVPHEILATIPLKPEDMNSGDWKKVAEALM